MGRRTRLLLLALSACGLCTMPACGTTATQDKPVACPSSASATDAEDMTHTLFQIRGFIKNTAPDQFTGIALSPSERAIEIYRVPQPDTNIDDEVCRQFPKTPLTFRSTKWNESEMRRASDRIWRDRGYWKSRNVKIVASKFARDFSAVEVQTPDPDRDSVLLQARYGDIVRAIRAEEQPVPATGHL